MQNIYDNSINMMKIKCSALMIIRFHLGYIGIMMILLANVNESELLCRFLDDQFLELPARITFEPLIRFT